MTPSGPNARPRPAPTFGDGPPPLALVAFDTPGIQRYLFGVQRPVDIEGGSRIVEAFVEREPDDDLADLSVLRALTAGEEPLASEANFVYLGGGSGLLAVARADAERAVDTIEDAAAEPERVPADWHSPNIVPFLVVESGSFLVSVAPRDPRSAEDAEGVVEVLDALGQAFAEIGAGAKTAVGYGRFLPAGSEREEVE